MVKVSFLLLMFFFVQLQARAGTIQDAAITSPGLLDQRLPVPNAESVQEPVSMHFLPEGEKAPNDIALDSIRRMLGGGDNGEDRWSGGLVYPSWPMLLLVAMALVTMSLAWRGERWEEPVQPTQRIRRHVTRSH